MDWLARVKDIVFPTRCLICAGAATDTPNICAGCKSTLPRNESGCRVCAVPLAGAATCAQCLAKAPAFERTLSPYLYGGAISYLVCRAKFHGDIRAAFTLGHLMAEALGGHEADLPQCIIPVPLHPKRLATRGFNQCTEIAIPLGRALGIPVLAVACRRIKDTTEQSRLRSVRDRRRNVRGAFSIHALRATSHVAIVDDVMTTGATAGELARELNRHGVEKVEVWTCARTMPDK